MWEIWANLDFLKKIITSTTAKDDTCLSLLREILNLGFSEDDVGVAGRALVNVGLVDDEQDVLRLPDGDAGHARDLEIKSPFR